MERALKVLIVDDDQLMRTGLRSYLTIRGMEVWDASNADEAVKMALERQPDVVILDIVMPSSDMTKRDFAKSEGVQAAKRIKSECPQMGIVLLSAYEDRGAEVMNMIQDGMRGIVYKLKGCIPSELEAAIHEAMAHRVSIDAEVSTGLINSLATFIQSLTSVEQKWVEIVIKNFRKLTSREIEIVKSFAASRTIDGVAKDLVLSPKTVQNHINRIYSKVGLENMDESVDLLRKSIILTKAYTIYNLSGEENTQQTGGGKYA